MDNGGATNSSRLLKWLWNKNTRTFLLFWALIFIVYLPAAKAGWVFDSAGWLWNIRHLSFWHYINNSQSTIPSLYQFTQLTTYIFYLLFHANPYAWHMLMVTMHAVNCFLLFYLCGNLFKDSGVSRGDSIAMSGVLLYILCPHASEVVVWEAAYHYIQGFLLSLVILICVQRFYHSQNIKLAWIAGGIFLCSTFSLEIFYLTPWLVLTVCLYYTYVLGYDRGIFRKAFRWFFIPQILMFAINIVILISRYGFSMAHIAGNVWQPFTNYACKPPRYIFHIVFLGRYFPLDVRQQVYQVIGSNFALIIFYNVFVIICYYLVSGYKKLSMKAKAVMLLFVWLIIYQAILLPLAFPVLFIVQYDRYTYFLDAFTYMMIAVLLSYISLTAVRCALLGAYAAINAFFLIKVNLYWKHSAYMVNRLMREFPDPMGKTVLLLNVAQNYKGIPMIGSEREGQYQMMYELFMKKNINGKVYDVASSNMNTPTDGAHVTVFSDSTIRVALNQWGTWWWYAGFGAITYENSEYKINMLDMGHWYLITLKHPHDKYLVLYEEGDRWRQVNWDRKNEDQY